jgi:antitoxin HigA-1
MEKTMFRKRRPALPGEILRELYLQPNHITQEILADAAGLSRKHISAIVNGRARIAAESAARIAAALGTTAQYWLNLQNAVDLWDASVRLEQDAEKKPHRVELAAAA